MVMNQKNKHIDELIDDMCFTLKENKRLIVEASQDFTRNININFNIEASEIPTMDIYVSKMVKSERLELEKQVELNKLEESCMWAIKSITRE